ncbi:MAG: hypothetical protein M1820_007038 [Bogoriella megaspora]|nr:MAG: hypothetical protein M1820_007038 [Bogoriella megaspora]
MSNAPTLINLPPPPSDPVTPSDMGPGTPNSTTTSMSELSTVAIKDGHRGHLPHHSSQMPPFASNTSHTSTLDAERADRISRLAGLERVAAPRPTPFNPHPSSSSSNPYPTQTGSTSTINTPIAGGGYFDPANPTFKERSTVGSASATGSIGGRTTWASGSDSGVGAPTDPDKMSETTQEMDTASAVGDEMETSSTGGFSDEGASLVAFGEGARTPARHSGIGSPAAVLQQQKSSSAVPLYLAPGGGAGNNPSASSSMTTQTTASAVEAARDARMIDGLTYDPPTSATGGEGQWVDTAAGRTPPPTTAAGAGLGPRSPERLRSEAERVVRENLDRGEEGMDRPMGQHGGEKGLGRFYFEGKGQ